MPWSNQTGGGQNGGSNGGNGNDGGGPWGQGPRGPQGPSGGQPPDLEQIIKLGQDRLKNAMPGGAMSPMMIIIALIGLVGLYVYTSAYQVDADELGVETVFGVPRQTVSEAGLHFAWWPVVKVEKVKIVERKVNIGSIGRAGGGTRQGLMLSGDQNIVDVSFTVLWSVDNPTAYLFNVADPEGMVREVAESAMREVVGRRTAQDIFRDDRQGISEDVRKIVQATLTDYGTGIAVRALNIEDVAPPREVADAFDEVQRAEQDEDRFQEEANQYRNKELGQARGEAAQISEDAAGYKNRVVEEAKGEAQRFISVYEQYAKAPEVTRKRLFLETMEKVLKSSNKVIMENGKDGTGVVPYLPLPEINKRSKGVSQ